MLQPHQRHVIRSSGLALLEQLVVELATRERHATDGSRIGLRVVDDLQETALRQVAQRRNADRMSEQALRREDHEGLLHGVARLAAEQVEVLCR